MRVKKILNRKIFVNPLEFFSSSFYANFPQVDDALFIQHGVESVGIYIFRKKKDGD
jgi:hypothetical protein